MVPFVLRKLILQTCMRRHPVDIWFSVGPYVYFQISCVRTAKALARLRGLCDKYHNLIAISEGLMLLVWNANKGGGRGKSVLIFLLSGSSFFRNPKIKQLKPGNTPGKGFWNELFFQELFMQQRIASIS